MKSIAIITTFRQAEAGYSLNRIVQDQIKMITRYGDYKLKVVVTEGFKPVEEYLNCELVEVTDTARWNEIQHYKKDEKLEEDVKKLYNVFKDKLADCDVFITHDIPYQPDAYKYNIALRKLAAERPEIRFLHWVHSATSPYMLSTIRGGGEDYLIRVATPFQNSFYIVFNEFMRPRVAGWFNIEESDVKLVPHPHDFTAYFDDLTRKFVEENDILQADRVGMYAIRLDRGKQVEFPIEVTAALKKTGRSVRLMIVDFQSASNNPDDDKYKYRQKLKELAYDLGLNDKEVLWMSEFDTPEGQRRNDISHKALTELYSLCNYHICSSRSETFYKGAQEAAIYKVPLILNYDLPMLRSIYGEAAKYYKFSSNIDILSAQERKGLEGAESTDTKYHDRMGYMMAIAGYINYLNEHTMVLKQFNHQRQNFNLKKVFKKYLEPLFYADDKFNI